LEGLAILPCAGVVLGVVLIAETRGEKSDRRDSNPHATGWKPVTLPLSYGRVETECRELHHMTTGL
jgi:hypothetical protein